MTTLGEWQGRVGRSWAESWQATDRTFAPVTARLIERAGTHAFAFALDIGCGAGELSCALHETAPQARIEGVDVSPELVAAARRRCPDLTFHLADAAQFAPAGPPPDLLMSRHGVMFFPDPPVAFAHLRAIAAPGARLLFSCFRARNENGWVSELMELVGAAPAEDRMTSPGPFAFADAGEVGAMLADAGWRDAAFERLDYAMVAGTGDDAVAQAHAYFQRIGPAAAAIAAFDPGVADAARERLADFLTAKLVPGADGVPQVALSASAWIVTARAGG